MSRSLIRQCIAYLLIALLPLQAAAASRLALCAEMGMTHMTPQSMVGGEPCAHMDAMPPSPTDKSATSNTGHCWLGSTCLGGLMILAVPATYAGVHIERNSPLYLPHTTLYHSIISESPLRPPATL